MPLKTNLPGYKTPLTWPPDIKPFRNGGSHWAWRGTPYSNWTGSDLLVEECKAQALMAAAADFTRWYGIDWPILIGEKKLGEAYMPLMRFWAAWKAYASTTPRGRIKKGPGMTIITRPKVDYPSWLAAKDKPSTAPVRSRIYPARSLMVATRNAMQGVYSAPTINDPRIHRRNPFVLEGKTRIIRIEVQDNPAPAPSFTWRDFPAKVTDLPTAARKPAKVQRLIEQFMYAEGYTLQLPELDIVLWWIDGLPYWRWRGWGTPYKHFSIPFGSREEALDDAWKHIYEDWERYTKKKWRIGVKIDRYIREAVYRGKWELPDWAERYLEVPDHPMAADKTFL